MPKTKKLKKKSDSPKNTVARKKITYSLREDMEEVIASVQKSLEQHTDKPTLAANEVIEQAVDFMNFGLNDEESRSKFLKLYKRWSKSRKD